MNRWTLRLFAFYMSAILLFTGCQSNPPTLLPVTGGEDAAPAEVVLVRDNVLEYVLSSSRLGSLPKDADWQLEVRERSEKENCFRNGNWLMIIRPADADDGNRSVIIINKVEHASWTGYITPNGRVVDTAYGR